MRKLIVSLTLLVLVAVIGLGWGLDRLFERVGDEGQADEFELLENLGQRLALSLDANDNPRAILQLREKSLQYDLSLQDAGEFPLPEELKTQLDQGDSLTLESERGISMHFSLPKHKQVLSISPQNLAKKSDLSRLNLVFTSLFYSGIVLLVLLRLYPLVTRLLILRETARRFGEGRLEQRIEPGRFSYIRDIENEFNRMAQKIQTLVSDNKLLAGAVSHDLRTPMARLRFGIDSLAEVSDPDKCSRYHKKSAAISTTWSRWSRPCSPTHGWIRLCNHWRKSRST